MKCLTHLGRMRWSPVNQVYGSLALEDNLEVGEAVMGSCRLYFLRLHHWLLAPSQKADQQLAMGPSERGLGDLPYL